MSIAKTFNTVSMAALLAAAAAQSAGVAASADSAPGDTPTAFPSDEELARAGAQRGVLLVHHDCEPGERGVSSRDSGLKCAPFA